MTFSFLEGGWSCCDATTSFQIKDHKAESVFYIMCRLHSNEHSAWCWRGRAERRYLSCSNITHHNTYKTMLMYLSRSLLIASPSNLNLLTHFYHPIILNKLLYWKKTFWPLFYWPLYSLPSSKYFIVALSEASVTVWFLS